MDEIPRTPNPARRNEALTTPLSWDELTAIRLAASRAGMPTAVWARNHLLKLAAAEKGE